MSEIIDSAVSALRTKMEGEDVGGSVRFVVEDEGTILLDGDSVIPNPDQTDADCTLTADAETFEALFRGELDPTAAFMAGKLTVDGDMGLAMKLAAVLA